MTVDLDSPFLGQWLHDGAGYVLFLLPPSGLVEINGLPSGWLLRSKRTVEESPTGRWERMYSPDASPAGYPEIRELDVYQSFDRPVYVSGEGPTKTVDIGGTTGKLTGPDGRGEMVFTFPFDKDEVALDANAADFTSEALVALAASASRD